VRWTDILVEGPSLRMALFAALHSSPQHMGKNEDQCMQAIGLMLEHRLQRNIRPRFNTMKRNSRAGGWREVDLAGSKSLGETQAATVEHLYTHIAEIWRFLSEECAPQRQSISHRFGGVVFPATMWQSQFVSDYSSR
jgi:hypothetical protein